MEKYMKNLTAARLNVVALQAECPHTMLQFAPATKHKRLAICLGGEILQNPGMCFVFFWFDFLVQELRTCMVFVVDLYWSGRAS